MDKNQTEMMKLISKLQEHTNISGFSDILRDNRNQAQKIFESRFTIQRSYSQGELSFQYIAVPICQLLARQNLKQCEDEYITKHLYNMVHPSSSMFLTNYTSCISELLEMDEDDLVLTLNHCNTSSLLISSLFHILYPLIVVIDVCLKKLPKASLIDIPNDVLVIIHKAYAICLENGSTSRNQRLLIKAMGDLFDNQLLLVKLTKPTKNVDGPGSLSAFGRRHDNDHENFRDIEIFPTPSEILSEREPYLPKLGGVQGRAISIGENGAIDEHLGAHFRLLREDLTRSFRLAIRQFIEMSAHQRESLVDFSFEVRHEENVEGLCFVWPDIRIRSIEASPSLGPAFVAEIPQIFPNRSQAERDHNWTEACGAKLLQAGSLLCLLRYPSQSTSQDEGSKERPSGQPELHPSATHCSSEPLMFFAKVLVDDRESLSKNIFSCFIQLAPVSPRYVSIFVKYLHAPTVLPFENHDRIFMLQLMGHFVTGTEKVLGCLKKLNIHSAPWTKALFGNPPTPSESVAITQISGQARVSPPGYLNPSTSYNLSFLGKTQIAQEELSSVNIYDGKATIALLRRYENSIILDSSQIEAFVRGISQQLSVIQGPPGCGKTFIGLQIVKAILNNQNIGRVSNSVIPYEKKYPQFHVGSSFSAEPKQWQSINRTKSKLGPILCVCFTNHALDQFLESLVNEGTVQLDEVVRIGSRSNSKLLAGRVLRKVIKPSRAEKQNVKSATIRFQSLKSMNDRLLESFSGRTQGSDFAKWMEENNCKLFLEISRENQSDKEIDDYFEIAAENWISSALTEEEHKLRSSRLLQARTGFLEFVKTELCTNYHELEIASESVMDAKLSMKVKALKAARIVGCTTSGAAYQHKLLNLLKAPIIIGEEAAEACEGHLLSTLSQSTKQLVLIGDHQQLRPRIAEYELTTDSMKGYDLDISLFERIARDHVVPVAKLSTQRRMHPLIGDLARLKLYPFLKDSEFVQNYESSPTGFQVPVFFWDHSVSEGENNDAVGRNRSYYNEHEVDLISALARYVVKQGYKESQIAVITPYIGQLKLLRARFAGENISVQVDDKDLEELILANLVDEIDVETLFTGTTDPKLNDTEGKNRSDVYEVRAMDQCLRLSTVDNFQGEEADIVLISTVRNNKDGKLGFLTSSNRTNVMLTRARKGMFIIGSLSTILSSPKSTHLQQVVSYLQEQGTVGTTLPLQCKNHGDVSEVANPSDFPQDGGCDKLCDALLSCGHRCGRQCHPDDTAHKTQLCQERCDKILPLCQHQCQKKCGEHCGYCLEPKLIRLACNHEIFTTCAHGLKLDNLKCETIVQDSFLSKCGHVVQLQCWEGSVQRRRCTMECGLRRECGHACSEPCHTYLTKLQTANFHRGRCDSICGQALRCGHPCQEMCHFGRNCPPCCLRCSFECPHGKCARLCIEPCVPCHQKCEWVCACGKEQRCEELCKTPCLRLPCDEKCTKMLECGHQCPSICGEVCPSKEYCFVCKCRDSQGEIEDDLHTPEYKVGEYQSVANVAHNDVSVVILKCGHTARVSQLDEYFEMDRFYERTEGQGWIGVKPAGEVFLDEALMTNWHVAPECVQCDQPIVGIRRYHRVTMLWHLYHQTLLWVSLLTEKFQRERSIQADLSDILWRSITKEEFSAETEQGILNLICLVRDGLVRMKNLTIALHEQHPITACKAENMMKFSEDSMGTFQIHLSALEAGALILEARVESLNLHRESQASNNVDVIRQKSSRKLRNIAETFRRAVALQESLNEKYLHFDDKRLQKELRSQYRKNVEHLKASLGVYCTSRASQKSKLDGRIIQLECETELTRISTPAMHLGEVRGNKNYEPDDSVQKP